MNAMRHTNVTTAGQHCTNPHCRRRRTAKINSADLGNVRELVRGARVQLRREHLDARVAHVDVLPPLPAAAATLGTSAGREQASQRSRTRSTMSSAIQLPNR